MLTDVEISRSLNAVSTTLRDQRPQRFETERVQQIVTGALAGERKIDVRPRGPECGELRRAEDGRLVALVEREEGRWVVSRKLRAGDSTWAVPQPAHSRQQAGGEGE